MALPAAVQYGQVRWRAVSAVADGNDPDEQPDAVPVTGTVTFAPSATVLLATAASPPITVFATAVDYTLGDDGVLRDSSGRDLLTLVATDSAGLTPVGWTWTASYRLNGGAVRGSFSFALPAGTVVDLTAVAPVGSSGGAQIVQGPAGPPGPPGAGLTLLGSLATPDDLPASGDAPGDAWLIDGDLWLWDGDSWSNVGSIQGPAGPEGPAGPTGAPGEAGPVGPQGPQGEQGVAGPEGPMGPVGPEGPAGPKGDTGDTGPAGADGTGVTILGSYATAAELNTAQPTGTPGDAYLVAGDLYVWDEQAAAWTNVGTIQGPQGPAGPTGPEGPVGPQGEQGIQGPVGATGPEGPQGARGEIGPKGDPGTDGRSAYEIARDQGYGGTEIQWLTTLKGDKGDPGDVGPQGEAGPQGPVGPEGPQGPKGDPGTTTWAGITDKPTIPDSPEDIGAQPAGDYVTDDDVRLSGAPVLVLAAGAAIPGGTPAGTVIVRTA